MQPDGRLYNGGTVADSPVVQADGVRLFEKQREQLAQMAAGRGTAAGFAEREGDRGRVVHEWVEESRAIEEISDEEYDEELDLEPATGVEAGSSSRLAEAAQASSQKRLKDAAASASQKFGMYSFLNSFASASGAQGNVGENGIGGVSAAQPGRVTAVSPGQPLLARGPEACNGAQGKEQSLRHFLCDPVSGTLMEDAVIFPCGHSVGTAGYQRVQETNACVVCFQQTNPMSAAPNHALREVVHAFKVERELPNSTNTRLAKRRREDDHQPQAETGKPKGVQFPYSVRDRVLIKGNKRTPERFVGREAIITTQCLNGWYLVRTIDNGESVRLQYRSLQKL